MGIGRRDFLWRSLLTTTGLGLWPLGVPTVWPWQSTTQVLAAPTRKLALLIGVNQYPDPIGSLQGSLLDIEMQRELLQTRFGFRAPDILTVTDQEATRTGLTAAFEQHLLGQVKAGDTVVIHFSGHGGQWAAATPWQAGDSQGPVLLLAKGEVLPLETLYLLLQALPTSRVSLVLDCGFTRPAVASHLRWRSPLTPLSDLDPATWSATQTWPDQLRQQYRIPTTSHLAAPQAAKFKGALLLAAAPPQGAAEVTWGSYSSGLFSHWLTRSLWESSADQSWRQVFSLAQGALPRQSGNQEQPTLLGRGGQPAIAPYFTALGQTPRLGLAQGERGYAGYVQATEGTRATLWLGGVAPSLLPHLASGTTWQGSVATEQAETSQMSSNQKVATVVLRTRQGLVARGESPVPLAVGSGLTETIRVLPKATKLVLALGEDLERIERVDATSALAGLNLADGLNLIETIGLQERVVDGVLGKLTAAQRLQWGAAALGEREAAGVGSYGLFWPGQVPMLHTFGPVGEAAKGAAQRLSPRLRQVLAAKRLRLTANGEASPLPLTVSCPVAASDWGTSLWQMETLSAAQQAQQSPLSRLGLSPRRSQLQGNLRLAVGEPLDLTLTNGGEVPLTLWLFGLDAAGLLSVIVAGDQPMTLRPQQAQPLSAWLPNLPLVPMGWSEWLIVATVPPLPEVAALVQVARQEAGGTPGLLPLPQPLVLTQALLSGLAIANPEPDHWRLPHQAWATLSVLVQGV